LLVNSVLENRAVFAWDEPRARGRQERPGGGVSEKFSKVLAFLIGVILHYNSTFTSGATPDA
jgi:hypothetical protein